MGRGKIEIKKIENINSRQVTFSKRRAGLLKKAQELSILCDAQVAVIIFSNTGKLFEFSSSEMKQTLLRYKRYSGSEDIPKVERKEVASCQVHDANEVDILKEEIARLRTRQLWLQGKELSGLSLDELQQLEKQLNDGLLSVKGIKEDLMMQQLNKSKMHEQEAILENNALRKQVEMLRLSIPFAQQFVPPFLHYPPPERLDFHVKHEAVDATREAADCNSSTDKESSDTTLHLGLHSNGWKKKRATPTTK